ncbi:unnamed protein product [Peniophora sp. CBMAI 1063]|nr:unnamed protein product [Peniophora sp. CBMAI 1063]
MSDYPSPSPELITSLNGRLHLDLAKVREDMQRVLGENELLRAQNAELRGENGRLEMENNMLRQAKERMDREVDELRALRDQGLLQDLSAATPELLIPSKGLSGILADNMASVFAGIDAVLEETKQRKFTVFDSDRPQHTLSRAQPAHWERPNQSSS